MVRVADCLKTGEVDIIIANEVRNFSSYRYFFLLLCEMWYGEGRREGREKEGERSEGMEGKGRCGKGKSTLRWLLRKYTV